MSDVAHGDYDLVGWAWRAFEHAFDAWQAKLPQDSDEAVADYLDRLDFFFEAHPKGWPPHPDDPCKS